MARPYKKRKTKSFTDYIHIDKGTGCHLWGGVRDRQGYGIVTIDRKTRRSHRIAWELAHGKIPEGLCVLHKCDNPSCVNVEHLFLGTRKDNAIDKMNKGRGLIGTDHCMCKLTESQVLSIRKDPRVHRIIAKEYGISNQHVSDIKTLRRWRHLGTD